MILRNQRKRRKEKRRQPPKTPSFFFFNKNKKGLINSSQRLYKSIIQNFNNSKLFEPPKYKKRTIKFLKISDYEKPTIEEERKKKATFQNPFLLFLSFVDVDGCG